MAKRSSRYGRQAPKFTVVLANHGLCTKHRTPILSDGDCWECDGPAVGIYDPEEEPMNFTTLPTADDDDMIADAEMMADWDHEASRPAFRTEPVRVVCQNNFGPSVKMMSAKQNDFLRKLLTERAGNPAAEEIRDRLNTYRTNGGVTSAAASTAIDTLLKIRKDAPVQQSLPAFAHGDILVDTDGNYYKVCESENGGHYAKVWSVMNGEGEWVYERGLLRTPGLRLATADEAAAWGHENHRCVFCGHNLSDDGSGRSVEVGYGPKCAAKHNLPWG